MLKYNQGEAKVRTFLCLSKGGPSVDALVRGRSSLERFDIRWIIEQGCPETVNGRC
jgi:hypothetical protein